MKTKDVQNALEQKLIEQKLVLNSATVDAETIKHPHCRDLWEIAEETERAVIIDNTLQNAQKNIKRIKNALLKIKQNDYGFCETCGDDIAIERLNILPEAEFCQTCQKKN